MILKLGGVTTKKRSKAGKTVFPDCSDYGLNNIEEIMCIGDGFIYVFRNPASAVICAARLCCIIEYCVARQEVLPIHFRVGIHTGMVNCFWDKHRWNYMGEGIIGGRGVLEAIGKEVDDVAYVSGQTRSNLLAIESQGGSGNVTIESILESFINRGRRYDKHRTPWRVYELRHDYLTPGKFPEGKGDPQLDC